MTHHLQRDLHLVDQVVGLSNKQRMILLSHDEHNICRDAVGSLNIKYSRVVTLYLGFFLKTVLRVKPVKE